MASVEVVERFFVERVFFGAAAATLVSIVDVATLGAAICLSVEATGALLSIEGAVGELSTAGADFALATIEGEGEIFLFSAEFFSEAALASSIRGFGVERVKGIAGSSLAGKALTGRLSVTAAGVGEGERYSISTNAQDSTAQTIDFVQVGLNAFFMRGTSCNRLVPWFVTEWLDGKTYARRYLFPVYFSAETLQD